MDAQQLFSHEFLSHIYIYTYLATALGDFVMERHFEVSWFSDSNKSSPRSSACLVTPVCSLLFTIHAIIYHWSSFILIRRGWDIFKCMFMKKTSVLFKLHWYLLPLNRTPKDWFCKTDHSVLLMELIACWNLSKLNVERICSLFIEVWNYICQSSMTQRLDS